MIANGRTITTQISGLSGVYTGKKYTVDAISNNAIFQYDSLVNTGYTRDSAIAYLYPNTLIDGDYISFSDSSFSFQLKSNAVTLIEIYNVNLGINQTNISERNISIFPNPASNQITISSDNVIHSVYIYDAMGKLVTHSENLNTRTSNLNVNLITGLYYVEVLTEKGVASTKLMINK